jgi:hypothetical protein
MKVRISALLPVLLCSAIACAAAQERKNTGTSARYYGSDPFVSWAAIWGDPKREGIYTCEEWKQYATRVFKEADRNHDGYVDAKEFEAIRKADPMFKDADIGYFDDNRDGRVSRSEFVDKPNPLFARYDKKGTCRVTLDDIANVVAPPGKSGREQDRR